MADAMTTAASAVCGRFWSRLGANSSRSAIATAPTTPGQLGPGAGGLRDRRARRAAADREALEEPGRQVGHAEPHHLLVRIDRRLESRGVGAREHAGVGERHQRDRDAAGDDRHQVARSRSAAGSVRAAPRERAEHGDPGARRQIEQGDDDGGGDHRDEHPRDARAALEQQDQRERAPTDREGASRWCSPSSTFWMMAHRQPQRPLGRGLEAEKLRRSGSAAPSARSRSCSRSGSAWRAAR